MEIYVCPYCGYSISLADMTAVDADKGSAVKQLKKAFEEEAKKMELMQIIEMQKMQIERCLVEMEQKKSVLNVEDRDFQSTDEEQKLSADMMALKERRAQLEAELFESQKMLVTLENEKCQMKYIVCPECKKEFMLSEARKKALKSDGNRFSRENAGIQKEELVKKITALKAEEEHIAHVQVDLEKKKAAMLTDRLKAEKDLTQTDDAVKILDEKIIMMRQRGACLKEEIARSQQVLDNMGR